MFRADLIIVRANHGEQVAKVQVVYVSFETLKNVRNADIFVSAWSQTTQEWQREVTGYLKNEPALRMYTKCSCNCTQLT
jgi:hypothetical protein